MYKYFLISFCLSLILTPLVRRFAMSHDFVARPSKDRWHKHTTALLGGIAIYLSLVLPLLFVSDFADSPHCLQYSFNHFFSKYSDTFLLLCITWFFLLGLWDDLKNLSPHSKLIGQIIGAAAFALAGFRLTWFSSLTIDTIITMVWIVGLVNAFNLIDNMDGLCAGIGLISIFFFIRLLTQGTIGALCLAGALAGFLIYNFNPASIFMGDCGSMLIGFFLAATGINYSASSSKLLNAIVVPVIILSVPIMDTFIVTCVRLLSGRKASVGGKDHTSHRLVAMGFSEREAVFILYGVSIFAGATAFFFTKNDFFSAPAILVPFTLVILLMGIYIAQIRIYDEKEFSVLREKKIPRILTNLAIKWQSLLVFLDFFLISFSYYLAYRLRFDNHRFVLFFKVFLSSLPVVIICKFAAFVYLDIYKNLWQHMGFSDLIDYAKASLAGSILSIACVTYLFRFESFSKGVFIIDFFLTLGLLIMVRGSFSFFTYISSKKQLNKGSRIMVYGAGKCGELFISEIMSNPELQFQPIGFVDRDSGKKGKKISGFRVLGNLDDLHKLIDMHNITGIIVSVRNIEAEELEKLYCICKNNNVFLKRFTLTLSDFNLNEECRI